MTATLPEWQPRTIAFALPLALPSLNKSLRTHWADRAAAAKLLNQEIMVAIGGPRHYPRPPFTWCRITVVQHRKQMLDPDNLAASCKQLLDVLKLRTDQNPLGLSIIQDDHPKLIELVVHQQPATDGVVTAVRIEERPQPFDPAPPAKKRTNSKPRASKPSQAMLARLRRASPGIV